MTASAAEANMAEVELVEEDDDGTPRKKAKKGSKKELAAQATHDPHIFSSPHPHH